jgi:hypothetical protein
MVTMPDRRDVVTSAESASTIIVDLAGHQTHDMTALASLPSSSALDGW